MGSILSPKSRIWFQFRSIFMILDFFRKVVMASWPGIYRGFGPADPKSAFRGFRSGPKRCTTNSYTESWRYHDEKCLLWPVHAHLRFYFLDICWSLLPFASLGTSEKCTLNISVNRRVSRYANPAPVDFGGILIGFWKSGRFSNGQEMAVGFK